MSGRGCTGASTSMAHWGLALRSAAERASRTAAKGERAITWSGWLGMCARREHGASVMSLRSAASGPPRVYPGTSFQVTRAVCFAAAGGEGRQDPPADDVAGTPPLAAGVAAQIAGSFGELAEPSPPLSPGLYVVGTPIGNLEDVTLRALRVLRQCDLLLAEDTRRTRKLLTHFGLRKPQGALLSYHAHSRQSRLDEALAALSRGTTVALVSDAGMPCISDPGSELVRRARQAGAAIHTIPGPCAFVSAASVAGLPPSSSLHFLGFLPQKPKHRSRVIQREVGWAAQAAPTQAKGADSRVVCFYVGPHDLLRDLRDVAREVREAGSGVRANCVVARELTKIHEEVWSGTIDEALEDFGSRESIKGELTVLVEVSRERETAAMPGLGGEGGGLRETFSGDEDLRRLLECLSCREEAMPTSQIASALSSIDFPLTRKQVYQMALAVKQSRAEGLGRGAGEQDQPS